jgi:Sel1 repeat/DnaJ domain
MLGKADKSFSCAMNEKEIVKALSVLGLKAGATAEECHLAWRSLSKQWHPDMHPAGSDAQREAVEKQREVNAAYDVAKVADLASLPVAPMDVCMVERPAESNDVAFERTRKLEDSGDIFAAADAYKRLANGGFAKAQFRLGYLYFDSIIKDLPQALHWWKRAAEQGHRSAQYNLGLMYEQGLGVPMDPKQAHQWFAQAAKNGDKAAQAKIMHPGATPGVMPTLSKAVEKPAAAAPPVATVAPAHGATSEQAGRAFIQRKNKN